MLTIVAAILAAAFALFVAGGLAFLAVKGLPMLLEAIDDRRADRALDAMLDGLDAKAVEFAPRVVVH